MSKYQLRVWSAKVRRRDKKCICCGSKKNGEAHHIQDKTHYPEIQYDIDNGVRLCKGCHTLLHTVIKNGFEEETSKNDLDKLVGLSVYFKMAYKIDSKLISIAKEIINRLEPKSSKTKNK